MNRVNKAVLVFLLLSSVLYLGFVMEADPFKVTKVVHHFVSPLSQKSSSVDGRASSTPSEDDYYKYFIRKRLAASEVVYQTYRNRRRRFVGPNPAKVHPWPRSLVMYFWDYFLPTFTCPHILQRIGNLGDGGKWVCGFELYEKEEKGDRPCIIYSFGVAQDSSFEAEFIKKTNCTIFAYDASVNKMGPEVTFPHPRIHFSKEYITTTGNTTLGKLMKRNGHKWIDFVKMDVEGGEFGIFNQIMDEFEILPFSQLHLEIHGDQEGKLFPNVYKLWERFEDKGLRPFKNEINHWPCVRKQLNPIYVEYSFINTLGPSRLLPYL